MKGDEITRSYIDPLNSKSEREKLLKVYYKFLKAFELFPFSNNLPFFRPGITFLAIVMSANWILMILPKMTNLEEKFLDLQITWKTSLYQILKKHLNMPR